MLSSLCLHVLHFLYTLAMFAMFVWKQLNRRTPRLLTAKRTKIPSHLALLLVSNDELSTEATEKGFVESVARAVGWCRIVGIEKLTVYDSQGITVNCSRGIQERLMIDHPPSGNDTDSEVEYPLTPPLSDVSESRPISPEHDCQLGVVTMQVSGRSASETRQRNVLKRRRPKDHLAPAKPLTLNLVSRESSKPGIASVVRSYIRNLSHTRGRTSSLSPDPANFNLSIDELGSILEGRHGLQPPDFMIVHHIYNDQTPLELHGFPPWQMRLTEIFHNRYPQSIWTRLHSSSPTLLLGEEEFRAALDEFAGAQMRLGK